VAIETREFGGLVNDRHTPAWSPPSRAADRRAGSLRQNPPPARLVGRDRIATAGARMDPRVKDWLRLTRAIEAYWRETFAAALSLLLQQAVLLVAIVVLAYVFGVVLGPR
jgi:hypothetical protein